MSGGFPHLTPSLSAPGGGEGIVLPELRFAQIPAAARPRYTGDRFSYMEAGSPDAFPLVLLHGIGANSMHWRFQFAGLSDAWRVIAWNAPGYMLSDNLCTDTPDDRDYADALHDFLTALDIGQAHILGNSFGSRVAQCFAAHYPGRIERLVMTGTGIGQRDLPAERRAAALAARERQMAQGPYAFGERVAALLGPNASAETVALVQHVLRATNPCGFMQAVRFALGNTCTLDFIDRLQMPILLIQGSEDRVNPADRNAEPLAAALPHARLVTLPGIGHLPEVEAWQPVNALVREFLQA